MPAASTTRRSRKRELGMMDPIRLGWRRKPRRKTKWLLPNVFRWETIALLNTVDGLRFACGRNEAFGSPITIIQSKSEEAGAELWNEDGYATITFGIINALMGGGHMKMWWM
jgi:hypothetical protein